MEPYYAGWLSILPTIIAIALALKTKDVILSLIVGILIGSFTYACLTPLNPFIGTMEVTFKVMVDRIDMNILLFCCLLGGLVKVISLSGASNAYARWATKRLKSKRSSLLATILLGILIFIDDYFNCLTVGTVMKPVTDKYKVSRAKLAYIIDSTAAPICILVPISSWAAAVGSNLRATGSFTSDFAAFVSTIPYNLYAILSLIIVLLLCFMDINIGPMAESERKAKLGDLGIVDSDEDLNIEGSTKGSVYDMLIPIGTLIVMSIVGMLYNGGFFGSDSKYHSLSAALGNASAAEALVWGSFLALVVAFIMFIPRKLMSRNDFMEGIVSGIKTMVPACIILILAWTISGICRDLLLTQDFIKNIVINMNMPIFLLPALIFVIGAFLSFSTGTAWGTFGILIPIIVPICASLAPELLTVSLSAVLAGSVFGDHCSPISDTTIISSTGAGCSHIEHVSTQMPYSLIVAFSSFIGYIVSGFTSANLILTLGSSLVTMFVLIIILNKRQQKLDAKNQV